MAYFVWEPSVPAEEANQKMKSDDLFLFEKIEENIYRLKAVPEITPPLLILKSAWGKDGLERPYLTVFINEVRGGCVVRGRLSRAPKSSESVRLLQNMDRLLGVPHVRHRGRLKPFKETQ